jgi:hypothetical protein
MRPQRAGNLISSIREIVIVYLGKLSSGDNPLRLHLRHHLLAFRCSFAITIRSPLPDISYDVVETEWIAGFKPNE